MFSILIQQHDSFVLGLSNAGKPNLVCTMGPFVVVQSLSCIHLFATPWTAAFQASLSFIISQSFSDSCTMCWWCHPTISSSVIPFSSCPQIFPSIRVFSNESALHIRWPKYWSFSLKTSPTSEQSGLTSFRMDWFVSPCSLRDSQESSTTPQFKSINSLALSFLYNPNLTSIHDHW